MRSELISIRKLDPIASSSSTIGTLRTDNAVVWKTRGPRVGLGRAPRTKRGKYVVKIKNAIIYTNSHRLENSKTLFTFPDKNDSKLI